MQWKSFEDSKAKSTADRSATPTHRSRTKVHKEELGTTQGHKEFLMRAGLDIFS